MSCKRRGQRSSLYSSHCSPSRCMLSCVRDVLLIYIIRNWNKRDEPGNARWRANLESLRDGERRPVYIICLYFFFFGVSVRVCESLIVLMRKRYKTERKRKESYSNRGFKSIRSTNVKLVNLEEPKCNGGVIFFTSKFIFQMLFRIRSIRNSK